jgi:Domain of unknown function (DUF4411)
MLPYWIDADVLIQASNWYYPFALVPKFWSFLDKEFASGRIKSTKIVWQEVSDGTDELARWVSQRREKGLCVAASKPVQAKYAEVSAYVYGKYKVHQAAEFLKGGDGWVIAHVMDTGGTVVTQESEKSKGAKVKVPTVCKGLNVKCINTFAMLKELTAGPF